MPEKSYRWVGMEKLLTCGEKKQISMEKINVRGKPKGLGKLIRRIPSYLFQLGITKPFEAKTLVLSTRGRKSGKTLKSPVGFAKEGNNIYLASLYQDSDWYQNALKNPEVEIQIGKQHLKAHALRIDDPEEKADAYRAIVRAQGEKGAEQYYYITPEMDDKEIGSIGKSLPIMRFELKNPH